MGVFFSERYHVFGLLVESELALPELIIGNFTPDVKVRFGKVNESIEKPLLSGICYKTDFQKFLLKVDGIAQYLVENGNLITIDRSEGGSDEEIRLFLLGSAFGALIHQRGILPLHGSAIVVDNHAIIFSGVSGAGKSTLAAGFVKRGYKLLADDVCVITLNEKGLPIAHPGYPQMKLWSDSLENLGHTVISLRRNRRTGKKISLPIQADFYNAPLPIKGIYVISSIESGNIEVETLCGDLKFNAINDNMYRLNFLKGSRNDLPHLKHIASISENCFVKRLMRPSKGFHISKIIELVENDIDIVYVK